MGEDTEAAAERPERIERATDLIGTEALWRGQIVHAGVELGLFERLGDGAVPASELAADLGLDAEYTYRLLRALAGFGVVDEDRDRRFSLTPVGELFRADHPHSVRRELLFNRSREWVRAMLHLPDIVREGGPPGFVREFDRGFFEFVRENPTFGEHYDAMIELAARDHPEQVLDALATYDLSRFSHVCDVGGGRGHLLCHVLEATPGLEGTVFDLPGVVAEEDRRWAQTLDVTSRCTYVGGDMFEAVPDADAHVLKWILHNFDDEDCRQILSNVHDAAPPDGRLFVVETVVPGPGTPHFAKRRDVTMMVQIGGRERTEAEYASLFEEAGWELVETWVPDDGDLSVLEGAKR